MQARARILLADDHLGVLENAAQILQGEFEVVGKVTNGRAAVDATFVLQPDLLVLDVMMPEIDGLDAARELKRRGCPAKIIFLSGHQDAQYVQAALKSGGLAYVLKSRMYTDLVPAISQVLSGCTFVSPATV